MPAPITLPASVAANMVNGYLRPGPDTSVPGLGTRPEAAITPGGALVELVVGDSGILTMSRGDRVLPEEGWFNPAVSPSHPVQVEILAFEVPKDQHLWLFDYRFQVYRFSGLDAGDALPAEEGRFSAVMGFDVQLSGQRKADISWRLDPRTAQVTRQQYLSTGEQGRALQSQFNRAAAASFAGPAGAGLSLLPVQSDRYGPRNGPFTIIARSNERMALRAVIWRPIPTPIAFIEAQASGYLVHTQISEALLSRRRMR